MDAAAGDRVEDAAPGQVRGHAPLGDAIPRRLLQPAASPARTLEDPQPAGLRKSNDRVVELDQPLRAKPAYELRYLWTVQPGDAADGGQLQAGLREATRRGWEWPDFLEYSIGPHREVLDAVMAHDPARAGEAMDRLVSQSQASFEYTAGPEARRPGGSAVGDPGPDGG